MPPTNTQAPIQPPAQPTPPPVTPQPMGVSPTGQPANKNTKWIIIGVVGGLVLGGLVFGAWLLITNLNKPPTNEAGQSADTAGVSRATWIEPATMPAEYEKFDDSFELVKTISYEDDTNDCYITSDVTPYGTYSQYGATPKEVALDLEGTPEDGVTVTKNEDGPTFTFKDTKYSQEYTFDSMILTKDINKQNLDYNQEYGIVAYKPFGVYAVSIGYHCKAETWEAQKPKLEELVKQFTIETVR